MSSHITPDEARHILDSAQSHGAYGAPGTALDMLAAANHAGKEHHNG